jgi:hypothetical protein
MKKSHYFSTKKIHVAAARLVRAARFTVRSHCNRATEITARRGEKKNSELETPIPLYAADLPSKRAEVCSISASTSTSFSTRHL